MFPQVCFNFFFNVNLLNKSYNFFYSCDIPTTSFYKNKSYNISYSWDIPFSSDIDYSDYICKYISSWTNDFDFKFPTSGLSTPIPKFNMILPEPKIFSLKPGVIQHMVNYSNNSFSLDNHLHTVLFNFMGNINPLHIKLIIGVFVVLTFCLGIWLFLLLIDIIHICIKNLLLYIKNCVNNTSVSYTNSNTRTGTNKGLSKNSLNISSNSRRKGKINSSNDGNDEDDNNRNNKRNKKDKINEPIRWDEIQFLLRIFLNMLEGLNRLEVNLANESPEQQHASMAAFGNYWRNVVVRDLNPIFERFPFYGPFNFYEIINYSLSMARFLYYNWNFEGGISSIINSWARLNNDIFRNFQYDRRPNSNIISHWYPMIRRAARFNAPHREVRWHRAPWHISIPCNFRLLRLSIIRVIDFLVYIFQ